MHWLHVVQHWLAIHTGTDNEPGPFYGFWSGFGSDIGELAIVGSIVTVYKHKNCASPRCWRIGKHPTADGMHHLCRKHHPDLMGKRRTLQEIHLAHKTALKGENHD
jgi:hypothetical protein